MKNCINCGSEVIEKDQGFYCPVCGLEKVIIKIETETKENDIED